MLYDVNEPMLIPICRSYCVELQCQSKVPTGNITIASFDSFCLITSSILMVKSSRYKYGAEVRVTFVHLIVPSGSRFEGELPPPSDDSGKKAKVIKLAIGITVPIVVIAGIVLGIILIRRYWRKHPRRVSMLPGQQNPKPHVLNSNYGGKKELDTHGTQMPELAMGHQIHQLHGQPHQGFFQPYPYS